MTALPRVSDVPSLWALAVRQPGRPGAVAPGAAAGQGISATLWREVLPSSAEPRADLGIGRSS